jgi:hypothetical protein
MKTKNTNCLYGFRCPKCESLEPFYIESKVIVRVTDSGTEETEGDIEWDDESYCRCGECDLVGSVKEFKQ